MGGLATEYCSSVTQVYTEGLWLATYQECGIEITISACYVPVTNAKDIEVDIPVGVCKNDGYS